MLQNEGKQFLEVEVTLSPLAGKRIVLDPGHGGKFPGAIGPGGTKEKDVVLAVCLQLQQDLVELGADVRMTRATDTEVLPGGDLRADLKARVDFANAWPSDLFISVHANAAANASAAGTETFHARQASDRSKTLAKLVQDSMIASVGLKDRGVKASDFYVIRNTTMPAILVETGFLSNVEEEKKLADPEVQKEFAHAIAGGVRAYLNVESHIKPDESQGPGPVPPDKEYYLAPGDPEEMLLAAR